MYGFKAIYEHYETGVEREVFIEFDGQFFDSERDAYIYAMGQTYDNCSKDECFVRLEFIYS